MAYPHVLSAQDFLGSQLQGVNGYGSWGPLPPSDYLPKLTAWGVNLVRVWAQAEWTGTAYVVDPAALDRLDAHLQQLGAAGINTVLVLALDSTGMPWTVQRRAAFVALWVSLASRYAGNLWIAFDLLNEPYTIEPPALGTSWSPAQIEQVGADWESLALEVTDGIRSVTPWRCIVYEVGLGAFPDFWTPARQPLPRSNVVYSPHSYRPHELTHDQVAEYTAGLPVNPTRTYGPAEQAVHRASIAQTVQWCNGLPMLFGEFSCARWQPGNSPAAYVADAIVQYRAAGASWLYHEFRGDPVWDAEGPNSTALNYTRSDDAPVATVLRAAFASNAGAPTNSPPSMTLAFSPGLAATLSAVSTRSAWVAAIVAALGSSRTITAWRADAGDARAAGVTFRAATLTGSVQTAGGSITSFGQVGTVSTQQAANLATGTAVVRIASADGLAWVQGTLGLPGSGADWTVRLNPTAGNGFAFGSTFRLSAPASLPEGAAPPAPTPPPIGTVITSLAVVEEAGQAGSFPIAAAVRLQPGAVPAGSTLQSPDDATLRAAVLATHADGSAMLVVVGGTVAMTANGSATIRLQAGAPAAGAALTAARIAELAPQATVAFTGGVTATVALNPSATPTQTWWASQQHVCASWMVPVPGTAGLCVVWVVHAWAGVARMLVECTVENSLVNITAPVDFVPVSYSAVVTIGGVAQTAVLSSASPEGDTHRGSRAWYASGWIGGSQSVRATMPASYLQTLPEFCRLDQPSSFDMAAYASDTYVPWGNGRIQASNMGGTGDHPAIGPLPQWECRALQSGDRRAWRATEASALSALSYNINTRDAASGLVPTFAQIGTRFQGSGWPRFVPTGSGGGLRGWEVAHAPDAGLMAFYARPTPVFIELAQKVAVWMGTVAAAGAFPITYQAGVLGAFAQTRGKAWGIRSIAHATLLSPDSHPWRAAGATAIERNVALLEGFKDEPRNSLGYVYYLRPDRPGDFSAGTPGLQQPLWMHYFLAGVLHRAQRAVGFTLGSNAGRLSALADWATRTAVRFVRESSAGEWRFHPYLETVANNNIDGTNGTPEGSGINSANVLEQSLTWGAQRAAQYIDPPPALQGVFRTHGQSPRDYTSAGWVDDAVGGFYYVEPFLDALACAVERGVPEASQAWETVEGSITNWATYRAGFGADPRFGAYPRNYVPSTWGQGAATGSISGDVWTPGRDGSGRINAASIATLAPNRWYEVAGSRLDSLEPQVVSELAALGFPGWTDLGSQDWQGVTNAYVGWALDSRPGQETAWIGPGGGGGSSASANNGLYKLDLRRITWSIEQLPTPVQAYPAGYTGQTIYPLVWQNGSPTGFYYSQTPAGFPIGADEVYDPAAPNDPYRSSRRPTTRHTYHSQVFVPELRAGGALIMGCRRQWLYDAAQRRWDPPIPMAGAASPDDWNAAENMVGWWDEVRGRYYLMANNLSASTADRCYWWNPVTGESGTTGNEWPVRGTFNGALAAQKIGRVLWCLQYTYNGAPTDQVSMPQRMLRWDLDTQTAQTFNITIGPTFNGRTFSSQSQLYRFWDAHTVVWVPSVNKWLCNTVPILPGGQWDDAWAWIDPNTWVVDLVNEPAGPKNWCFFMEGKVAVVDGLVIALASGSRNMMVMRPA